MLQRLREQSLAHLFKASNAVDEEPSSAGTETEAFNPLSDDGAPSYDAPAAPAAPVIPDTSVAHQPEESHGITIAPDSSLAALAQMAQNIDGSRSGRRHVHPAHAKPVDAEPSAGQYRLD